MSQAGILNLSSLPPPPGFVVGLAGNSGGNVGPNGSGIINVVGDGFTTNVVGTPGTNTLTISVINEGFTWSDQAVTFNAQTEHGYFCTAGLTVTLPVSLGLSEGNTIKIYVDTSSPVIIQAQANETIEIGLVQSTMGGTATNSIQGSTVELVFRVSDNTWHSFSNNGTWTMA